MNKIKYDAEADLIVRAIDIAIRCFIKFPPKNFEEKHIQQFVDTYADYRNKIINPEPKFHNLTSLKYAKSDVLTYFQEGSGATVDYFWQQINSLQLGYKRENKLEKILKRKKIKNDIEYDFITDVIVPYQQENIITPDQVKTINNLLAEYESNPKQGH